MRNFYLWQKNLLQNVIPSFWCSAKTWHEENGVAQDWNWCDPYIHEKTIEQVMADCVQRPPSVFALSIYVWNESEADALAKQIRAAYPKCLILYGGPQNNTKHNKVFFDLKPWVDLVFTSDVYGEVALSYVLDNYAQLKKKETPNAWYQQHGLMLRSPISIDKRKFVWPKNIYKAQETFISSTNFQSLAIYETTRGCPFQCTYCDWGGGTHTKVSKKPLDTVKQELEWLVSNQVSNFIIADANFGMFEADVEMAEFFVYLKKKYCVNITISDYASKNNLDRVSRIREIFGANDLCSHYRVSVQSLNDEIKNNVKRSDLPFQNVVKHVKNLVAKYPKPVVIETIIGLPGDSFENVLDQIELLSKENLSLHSPYFWILLPEAPAYDEEYRNQHKIKTVPFYEFNNRSEVVVSTYSYTEQDLVKMVWAYLLFIEPESEYKKLIDKNALNIKDTYTKLVDWSMSQPYYMSLRKLLLARFAGTLDVNNSSTSFVMFYKIKEVFDKIYMNHKKEFDLEVSKILNESLDRAA